MCAIVAIHALAAMQQVRCSVMNGYGNRTHCVLAYIHNVYVS
jgi:hypothetical protein